MKKWKQKEKKDAKSFGTRPMPRSGGLWFAKGDSRNDKFLIESKHTIHKGFTITGKLWEKLEKEGLLNERIPLLSVELGSGAELVILDKNDFIELSDERIKIKGSVDLFVIFAKLTALWGDEFAKWLNDNQERLIKMWQEENETN